MSNETYSLFREKLGQVLDVRAAVALMQWDQEIYMPPKSAPMRGRQMATLSALGHQMFTDPEMGDLLKRLSDEDALDADQRSLVAETQYDYERATKLPTEFVERFAEEQSRAFQAWKKAREANDYGLFVDNLRNMVALSKEQAEYHGYEGSRYNALLEEYERGMTAEALRPIFSELAEKQGALVERIMASPNQPDVTWTEREWDVDAQWAFTLEVLKDIGYDFEAGRQDKSVHPFTTTFDLYDVRVTTRVHPKELFSALTGTIHEGGHALYEQGFRPEDQRTVLASAPSLGMHESQSRMWENVIGRSLPFWKHYAPKIRKYFPGQLDHIEPEQFYRAINQVQPSFIRVEADECTYNLHIILRFEIEVDLIEERITVDDIPEVWNAKMKQYLGLDVPDDAHGCLQDIHWSHGSMGYFPTYALGNLYAAQLFEKIEADVPKLWECVGDGNFSPLLSWLRQHVHQVGRRMTAPEIVEAATGKQPDSAAFLRYLESKYAAVYGV